MALKFNQNSTNYLRPDFEYNQLNNNNTSPLVGGANFDTTGTALVPTVRTTGNGLVYLNGALTATANGGNTDIIVTFPLEFGFTVGNKHYLIQRDSGGVITSFGVRLQLGTGEMVLVARQAYNSGDFLYLDPVFFFRGTDNT